MGLAQGGQVLVGQRSGRGGAIRTPDPLRPRRIPVIAGICLFSLPIVSNPYAPLVVPCGAFLLSEAFIIYDFVYALHRLTATLLFETFGITGCSATRF